MSHSLNKFLEILNISEEEFNKIVLRHAVSPNEPNFEKIITGPELKDSKLWPEKNYLEIYQKKCSLNLV